MSPHVRQCLLRDPVRSDLDGSRERRKQRRRYHGDDRLRPGLLGGEPAERGSEAQLVERRRAQTVDQAANVSDHRLHLRGRRDQQRIGSPEIRRRQIANGLERERQPGERRAEAVVEIAPDPPPFLLAQLDDALPRRLQLVRELDRVDSRSDLRRQVGDQPFVALPKVLTLAPGETKLTDDGALVDERDDEAHTRRRAVLSDPLRLTKSPTYCTASVWPSVSTTVGSTA